LLPVYNHTYQLCALGRIAKNEKNNSPLQVGSVLLIDCSNTPDGASLQLPLRFRKKAELRFGAGTATEEDDDVVMQGNDEEDVEQEEVGAGEQFDWAEAGDVPQPEGGDDAEGGDDDDEDEDEEEEEDEAEDGADDDGKVVRGIGSTH
jgi:hypothetical protein